MLTVSVNHEGWRIIRKIALKNLTMHDAITFLSAHSSYDDKAVQISRSRGSANNSQNCG